MHFSTTAELLVKSCCRFSLLRSEVTEENGLATELKIGTYALSLSFSHVHYTMATILCPLPQPQSFVPYPNRNPLSPIALCASKGVPLTNTYA